MLSTITMHILLYFRDMATTRTLFLYSHGCCNPVLILHRIDAFVHVPMLACARQERFYHSDRGTYRQGKFPWYCLECIGIHQTFRRGIVLSHTFALAAPVTGLRGFVATNTTRSDRQATSTDEALQRCISL